MRAGGCSCSIGNGHDDDDDDAPADSVNNDDGVVVNEMRQDLFRHLAIRQCSSKLSSEHASSFFGIQKMIMVR